MLAAPAICGFDLLEHGNDADRGEGPNQRLNRKLTDDEVALIREMEQIPPYRIWKALFKGKVSYHTVRRVANRELYKEQP